MAKRTRYPNRTAKQQAKRAQRSARAADAEPRGIVPGARPAPADAPIPVDLPDDEPVRATSSSLTEAEMRRAEELEAEATRKEKAAIAEQLRKRARADEAAERPYVADPNQPLSVRAAHEYAYVARDVKRITVVGGLMLGILAVLHILINVLGVVSI
jgi:hypothetical protein